MIGYMFELAALLVYMASRGLYFFECDKPPMRVTYSRINMHVGHVTY